MVYKKLGKYQETDRIKKLVTTITETKITYNHLRGGDCPGLGHSRIMLTKLIYENDLKSGRNVCKTEDCLGLYWRYLISF